MGAYIGRDTGNGQMGLWFEFDDGNHRQVPHVVKHSPAGLSWGYEGSGPSDTALSLLTDITQDRAVAERWYQEFKREVVARLQIDRSFRLPRAGVERWLAGRGVGVPSEVPLPSPQPGNVGPLPLATSTSTGVDLAERLAERSAALDAREAALDAREHELDRRELRTNTWEASLRHDVGETEARWTLPAEPVKLQIEALLVQTQNDLPTVARGINVEPEWAAGVMDGTITEVDLDHVQRLCEGLHCTPYDFWDAESGRSIVHAYGPELWPRYIEPLAEPPGPGLGGPELGL